MMNLSSGIMLLNCIVTPEGRQESKVKVNRGFGLLTIDCRAPKYV
ncbi:hypothetical protein NIES4103_11210 [Nostoc sp. NIES-4103]|nr:hypothetical protein NIES4103_11210 [Nostoc sp. NIES-4103]